MRICCQSAMVVLTIAASLTGCRSTGTAPLHSVNPLLTTPPTDIKLVSGESTSEAHITPAPTGSFNQLTLLQAIELGLAHNPDLVTQRQAERVSEAALGVAETYPFNPSVQIQATPYQRAQDGVGGDGNTNHYVLLMQQIQLANQQQHREEGASAALNSTRWSILQAQLLNVAQTERLYFSALYQRGVRDLTKANADNNEQLLTIFERQLQAGQATAADVSIVRLDVQSTRQQAQLVEANYQTAMLDLKRQLNLPMSQPLELHEDLTRCRWHAADGNDIVASLAANRPDVLAARASLDAARANCQLADAARTPDLQAGPYYQKSDSGVTFVGFRAQIDLPIINNGSPLLRQRSEELHQQTIAWQQLQTRAELEARAAIDRYERARQLIAASTSTNDTALPIELQKLEAQFVEGEVDVLRIFQARTSLIQSRRVFLDTLNELAQSAAAVTAATGVPPQSLVNDAIE